MKTEQFDARFDDGEDITDYLDIDKAQRPASEQRRTNEDFPAAWMIDALDREAKRLGISRQAVMKVWIVDLLEQQNPAA